MNLQVWIILIALLTALAGAAHWFAFPAVHSARADALQCWVDVMARRVNPADCPEL